MSPGVTSPPPNLGPMGWAIPAGIGAKAARPDRPLVVVTGDGCMLMHGMELQTAARYGIAGNFCRDQQWGLGNVWLRARRRVPAGGAHRNPGARLGRDGRPWA